MCHQCAHTEPEECSSQSGEGSRVEHDFRVTEGWKSQP